MPTDRDVQHLIINKLTKAQYEAIANPDPDQLYFIIDDNEYAEVSDLPQPSNTAPGMDGTAAAGVAATYSRSDHIHPIDTSRAPINSPAFTGQPTTPTPVGVTTTINGIQNVALSNLQAMYGPESSTVPICLRQEIATQLIDVSDADFLNVTFNGTAYVLPRTATVEAEDNNNNPYTIDTWGGITAIPYYIESANRNSWSIEADFIKYPLGIAYVDNGSTGVFAIGVPKDYDEESSSITITSYTSKPDNQKIVNVGYLDSVLADYESASSLRPEDDENVLNMLTSLGLANVLTDTDNSVLIDNDNVAIGGHSNGNNPLFYNSGR